MLIFCYARYRANLYISWFCEQYEIVNIFPPLFWENRAAQNFHLQLNNWYTNKRSMAFLNIFYHSCNISMTFSTSFNRQQLPVLNQPERRQKNRPGPVCLTLLQPANFWQITHQRCDVLHPCSRHIIASRVDIFILHMSRLFCH